MKFLLILFLLDFVIGTGLKALFHKGIATKQGKFYREMIALDSTRADILIVGTSRAFYHYIPKYFEDSFHTTCYNAGYEGSFFLHQCAVLKTILNRYTPKIIIWDYYAGLMDDPRNYSELRALLPFYESHSEIQKVMELKSPLEKYKMLSRIYPFNSTFLYNLSLVIGYYKNSQAGKSVNGVTLHGAYAGKKSHFGTVDVPVDTNCIAGYKWIVEYCKQKKIKLFVVVSPLFETFEISPAYNNIAKQIAEENGFPFLDFSNGFPLDSDRIHFRDFEHLNFESSQLFTYKVIAAIKQSLRDN